MYFKIETLSTEPRSEVLGLSMAGCRTGHKPFPSLFSGHGSMILELHPQRDGVLLLSWTFYWLVTCFGQWDNCKHNARRELTSTPAFVLALSYCSREPTTHHVEKCRLPTWMRRLTQPRHPGTHDQPTVSQLSDM